MLQVPREIRWPGTFPHEGRSAGALGRSFACKVRICYNPNTAVETPLRCGLDGRIKISWHAICLALGLHGNRMVDIHLVRRHDPLHSRVEAELESIASRQLDAEYTFLGGAMPEQQLVRRLKTVLRRRQEFEAPPAPTILTLRPIGQVEAAPDADLLDLVIDDVWAEALEGIEAFSHLWVIWWLSGRTDPPPRLRIRPERRDELPLMGLFATRSPHRPNPIAITAVRLVDRQGTRLRVAGLDAHPGSPVLDLKPYLRRGDLIESANTPPWLAQLWAIHDQEQQASGRR